MSPTRLAVTCIGILPLMVVGCHAQRPAVWTELIDDGGEYAMTDPLLFELSSSRLGGTNTAAAMRACREGREVDGWAPYEACNHVIRMAARPRRISSPDRTRTPRGSRRWTAMTSPSRRIDVPLRLPSSNSR